ncbi:MAG: glycosyltransferase family 9 protein [Candidatus Edwardsbacteria bacterium]|nr:glycosyltransferase family 9 protein [Candidatus Edwardsbacteria bacterium]
MHWKSDCRHFAGARPCKYSSQCAGCNTYRPWKESCLIIKLAAKGDVLRTTPLAMALKQHRPDMKIAWLTDHDAAPLLYNNPSLDELLCFDAASLTQLSAQHFSRIICLDKEPRAAALASILEADKKTGFGWDPKGYLVPLDKRSRYLYDLGLSDQLKFRSNRKSYQQLVIESAGLEYANQKYQYHPSEKEIGWATEYLAKLLKNKGRLPLIGLNTGVGRAFPTKAWPADNYARLAKAVKKEGIGQPMLLGGPDETALVEKIAKQVPGTIVIPVDLDIRQFAALISCLDVIVSADSLAMHLGIALEKKVIALFGPTCQQEIELYGRGEKLSAATACSPCYRQSCPDLKCMAGITPGEVLAAVMRNL